MNKTGTVKGGLITSIIFTILGIIAFGWLGNRTKDLDWRSVVEVADASRFDSLLATINAVFWVIFALYIIVLIVSCVALYNVDSYNRNLKSYKKWLSITAGILQILITPVGIITGIIVIVGANKVARESSYDDERDDRHRRSSEGGGTRKRTRYEDDPRDRQERISDHGSRPVKRKRKFIEKSGGVQKGPKIDVWL